MEKKKYKSYRHRGSILLPVQSGISLWFKFIIIYYLIAHRLIFARDQFIVARKASLLGQQFIFHTVFQPRALSSNLPVAWRGLFTKYTRTKESTKL